MTHAQRPIRVLMVCLGNICRSPTAEAVFRHHIELAGLSGRIEVDSAGIGDWHQGQAPDPRSCEAAAQRRYDLSALRARQVRGQDFVEFDYLFAMDRQNLEALQQLCPPQYRSKLGLFLAHGATGHEEVPDPYYCGGESFELVLDLVEAASAALVAALSARHALK